MTTEQISTRLQQSGVRIGRATLFRNLKSFVESGLAERVTMSGGPLAFTACPLHDTHHHHHLICTNCHTSIAVEVCLPDHLLREVEDQTLYRITGHQLQFSGLCRTCQDTVKWN